MCRLSPPNSKRVPVGPLFWGWSSFRGVPRNDRTQDDHCAGADRILAPEVDSRKRRLVVVRMMVPIFALDGIGGCAKEPGDLRRRYAGLERPRDRSVPQGVWGYPWKAGTFAHQFPCVLEAVGAMERAIDHPIGRGRSPPPPEVCEKLSQGPHLGCPRFVTGASWAFRQSTPSLVSTQPHFLCLRHFRVRIMDLRDPV